MKTENSEVCVLFVENSGETRKFENFYALVSYLKSVSKKKKFQKFLDKLFAESRKIDR